MLNKKDHILITYTFSTTYLLLLYSNNKKKKDVGLIIYKNVPNFIVIFNF